MHENSKNNRIDTFTIQMKVLSFWQLLPRVYTKFHISSLHSIDLMPIQANFDPAQNPQLPSLLCDASLAPGAPFTNMV